MRFQDAVRDARAAVYAAIQAEPVVARAAALLADATPAERVLARAVMNGESDDPAAWRIMFPALFADGPRRRDAGDGPGREHGGVAGPGTRADEILAVALEVAARGDRVRDQVRGAIVEALTEVLLRRSSPATAVRRERRILFDGVPAEIHPYDVTVEIDGRSEAWDCKWGARGIDADVLHQLDDARDHAADEDEALVVGLVVFDAERSCRVRLDRQTAPIASTRLVTLESLDGLAGAPSRRTGP